MWMFLLSMSPKGRNIVTDEFQAVIVGEAPY
jgi:hypothetical protein